MKTISEQLRSSIEACGMTRAELSRASGVPESALSRFVVSGQELRTGNVDRLCRTLGLVLAAKSDKARKGR